MKIVIKVKEKLYWSLSVFVVLVIGIPALLLSELLLKLIGDNEKH